MKTEVGAALSFALAGLAVAVLLAACTAASVSLSSRPSAAVAPLEYSNQSSLSLQLVVNERNIRTLEPHSSGLMAGQDLPAQPWVVEARTSSGRIVASMTVKPGDVSVASNRLRGDGVRVGLSCGSLDIWSGPPLAGPPAPTGSQGDCAP